ncbi:uncharacterized protein LOC110824456 [Carica papaya]|uniref:uncharacterized protein LOC110815810 n=1 Tax=Carica papaya TaxID=3649 RepID=UPI000B8CF6D8|nr:uncharacterized protein LOC110815810 [Carica papaya]XP_021899452.1 uncharacterized protein LOC110815810 [Carica papaya]XP_021899453.1 uncharacterized protein LOC110815810 [Carica papaya]XP_021899454.1 uncharacterized protein LOC110815810 [Carica papaya]XP_021899455.1 uncharacterized protein LOC110815810 [Carica papaya]XP_021899456.1 uncharacterized protein LOC110815810 [Carica papaya]XP_021910734.1 uncharacterized protein LOC110824456 [Carica papaya]
MDLKMIGRRAGTSRLNRRRNDSKLGRLVAFLQMAEFEIVFFCVVVVAFFTFKQLTARPEYNQILVKKPGGPDFWPH